jgi:hypothetical protein
LDQQTHDSTDPSDRRHGTHDPQERTTRHDRRDNGRVEQPRRRLRCPAPSQRETRDECGRDDWRDRCSRRFDDGRLDGRLDRRIDRRLDRRLNCRLDCWLDRRLDGRLNRRLDRRDSPPPTNNISADPHAQHRKSASRRYREVARHGRSSPASAPAHFVSC